MALRYIPLELKHPPKPGIQHFALLAGTEAAVRAALVSVMPLAIHDALGSTVGASKVYFLAGIVSLVWGLMVPMLTQVLPRRWTYTAGVLTYLVGMGLAMIGTSLTVSLALLVNNMATVTTFICLNAYVLDYIDRTELGRGQSVQMLYAATPWAIGPILGVWLYEISPQAPFMLGSFFAIVLLIIFWVLRLGNGKQISRARRPAVSPIGYLKRFFAQPRLISGWIFAVIRACGWWVYIVYLPYFCIEAGLGNQVGGVVFSASNALLFIAPLLLRLSRRFSVRNFVRAAFGAGAILFIGGGLLAPFPWLTVGLLFCASVCLVMLDVAGGLPFLMSVKPSERTEMSAVYASFRDVSGILTPGVAWAVLAVAPTAVIFIVCGAAMGTAHMIAGRLHPRLGVTRPSRGGAPVNRATAAQ